MQLTEADLQLIEYSNEVYTLLNRATKERILATVKGWFRIKHLRPKQQLTTWDDYGKLENGQKLNVIDRILLDWPDGLNALQIAQIDLQYHMNRKLKRQWFLWELMPDPNSPERFEPFRETSAVCHGIEDELTHYYKCHVASAKSEDIPADWIRIALYENRYTNALPPIKNVKYMIRYPGTPFILVSSTANVTSGGWKQVFQRVLITSFGVQSVKEHSLSGDNLDDLTNMVLNRNSLGPFSQFRLNQFDVNPLDYREMTKKRPTEASYVETRDQRRRIVPLDRNQLQARARGIKDVLGLNVISGIHELTIHIKTRLTCMSDKIPANMHSQLKLDKPINIKLTLKGSNVMEGLRELMYNGILEPPIPEWYAEIASRGINKVWITEDGVMREAGEDEDDGFSGDEDDMATQATQATQHEDEGPDEQGITKIF